MKRNNRVDSAHMCDLSRREFLELSAGAAALSMLGWPQSVGAQPGTGGTKASSRTSFPPRATNDS